MTELSAALKRQITEDWHRLFPQMSVYKPMWLARRVGPLVQGVCLDRDSGGSAYFPTTHIHNLCRPFPTISLSLAQRLLNERSGSQERISAQFHEQHYLEAAQRLTKASLLPLFGDLTMHQVLDAHRGYRELNRPDSKYPVLLFEDGILLFAWSGQPERATELLNQYIGEMHHWPATVMARYSGVSGWEKLMVETIENRKNLQVTAESQAQKLKAADLPPAQLLP
jgi:hypothetical protein